MMRCSNVAQPFVRSRSPFPGRHLSFRHEHKRSLAEFGGGSQQEVGAGFFAWYSKKLDTHPLTTKCISAGLISSVGNVLAQGITFYQKRSSKKETSDDSISINAVWKDFKVDPAQVGRFAFLNVIFVAPVLHYWYGFINRAIPGLGWSEVIQRTFWDEFVFSPVYIPVFLAGLWRLEGTGWPKVRKMITSEVPGIIVAEWALWVPTMLVTFRYAPVKFQVLVINVVGVVWQTFLSFMAAHAHESAATDVDTADQKAGSEPMGSGCDKVNHQGLLVEATAQSSHREAAQG